MLRRSFTLGLGGLALSSCATGYSSRSPQGPLFWTATRGESRVFLLGFGEARDMSWFTPSITSAFNESAELWLETAGSSAPDYPDAAAKQAAEERIEKLSFETGRSLFDVLEPSVRERTLAYMAELDIKKESVETLRPWRAYYVINGAFWSRTKRPFEEVYVDAALREQAAGQGKSLQFEMPTREAFVEFMAGMPDPAQSQYVEWLLDFLDDYKNGLYGENETFGWTTGAPYTRTLDRMRTKMPDLYRIMQAQRNAWWARKIDELLDMNGSRFIAVGQLHTLGPDGIPSQMRRLEIVRPGSLLEGSSA